MYLGLNLGYFMGSVQDIKRRAYAMKSLLNVVTVGYPDTDETQPSIVLDLAICRQVMQRFGLSYYYRIRLYLDY
eukprot:CAMPEP_0168554344 /NCGR_PEP_ID=MMETSP0413-20121227/7726_1 /TAXON_ID=136452 /ORGANISM="Filamoeba nolandi, Strain NC-AS-23-1" /LENGTH=73 /DNA_ID=CAMNT_0008585071 /DNA_START=280 /DNA_END=498 /DNA_ORIENTATION=-